MIQLQRAINSTINLDINLHYYQRDYNKSLPRRYNTIDKKEDDHVKKIKNQSKSLSLGQCRYNYEKLMKIIREPPKKHSQSYQSLQEKESFICHSFKTDLDKQKSQRAKKHRYGSQIIKLQKDKHLVEMVPQKKKSVSSVGEMVFNQQKMKELAHSHQLKMKSIKQDKPILSALQKILRKKLSRNKEIKLNESELIEKRPQKDHNETNLPYLKGSQSPKNQNKKLSDCREPRRRRKNKIQNCLNNFSYKTKFGGWTIKALEEQSPLR